MICSWNSLLDILPIWLRVNVSNIENESLEELRMRINAPPELVFKDRNYCLDHRVQKEDLSFCINMASRYSPWATSSISQGYITAPGGHRIGICGEAVFHNGIMTGIKNIRSICIRVSKDFPGISRSINTKYKSILILGAPGSGKTTLLRDLIRNIGKKETICVVDERGEIFPEQFHSGDRVDVLTGCKKHIGLELTLRTMGPNRIALDEITALEDAEAIMHAAGCGVGILATAHASSIEDMKTRPIYRKIWDSKLFDSYIIVSPNRTYHQERASV